MKEITRAESGDALKIFRLNQNQIGAPGWSAQQFLLEIEEGGSVLSRASDQQINGFILFRKLPEAFEISYLATHPEFQRQGVMKTLLSRLVAYAAQSTLPVWLEVHEQNQGARALYEKLGFKLVGKRPSYYADGAQAMLYNYG